MLLSLTSPGCSEGHATCCCEIVLSKLCKEGSHESVLPCSWKVLTGAGGIWSQDTHSTAPSQLPPPAPSTSYPPPPKGLEPLGCCCLHLGLSSHFNCPHLDNHSQTSQRWGSWVILDPSNWQSALTVTGVHKYVLYSIYYYLIVFIIIGTKSH